MPTLWLLWVMWVAWRPSTWLWVLPAALPVASLSPWSGWLVFDEFDLLVLGALSALQARQLLDKRPAVEPQFPVAAGSYRLLRMALWLMVMVGLIIGYARGEAVSAHLFAEHQDSMWSVRASKAWVWALLLWPWMHAQLRRAPEKALHQVGRGMLMGLALVTAASLSERMAYPGLFDFNSHYRTTALFWEMNVGGAAIDVYLAMAAPFAAWAVWRTYTKPNFLRWLLASVFAVLVTYVCLTTFARGVYLAVSVSMLVLAIMIYRQWAAQGRTGHWPRWLLVFKSLKRRPQHRAWRLPATVVLVAVLVLEVIAVLDGGSFMARRIDDGAADFSSRMTHWRNIVGLLETPQDWALGLGAGRFAAEYAGSKPDRSFSGALSWSANAATLPPSADSKAGRADLSTTSHGIALLQGPQHRANLGGLYSMTQRIQLETDGLYNVRVLARVAKVSQLLIRVCEKHLLYDKNCQAVVLQLKPSGNQWTTASGRLRGPRLDAGSWWAPRQGVVSVAVLTVQSEVQFDRVELFSPKGTDVLRSGGFSDQLAHWFPSAQRYYLPWHTDNLFLELLVERGALGVLVFAALLVAAVRSLHRALPGQAVGGAGLVPVLMASVVGMLCVGLVSSVLDVPRLSFLVCFLLLLALALGDQPCAGADATR